MAVVLIAFDVVRSRAERKTQNDGESSDNPKIMTEQATPVPTAAPSNFSSPEVVLVSTAVPSAAPPVAGLQRLWPEALQNQ